MPYYFNLVFIFKLCQCIFKLFLTKIAKRTNYITPNFYFHCLNYFYLAADKLKLPKVVFITTFRINVTGKTMNSLINADYNQFIVSQYSKKVFFLTLHP